MSNTQSAEIIPFPGFFRPPAAIEASTPVLEPTEVSVPSPVTPMLRSPGPELDAEDPSLRLQRALALLSASLAEQRDAVAQWRTALTELNGSMRGLGSSLSRYQETLGSVAQSADRQKG